LNTTDILIILAELYPDAEWAGPKCEADPLQTLVATMLSAQCRDDYVDRITPGLFAKYKTPQDWVNTPLIQIQADISSINHYKKKAVRIQEACRVIIDKHNGLVPLNFDDLTKMNGVGNKTANATLRKMGLEGGYVVDTHCKRIAYRLGLTTNPKNAEKTRKELEAMIPKEQWGKAGWRMILHGRNVCKARKPKCDGCRLNGLCLKRGVVSQSGVVI
jgi:endonuclease-3